MSSNKSNIDDSLSSSTQSLAYNTSSDEDFFKSESRSRCKTRRRARLRVNPNRTKIRVKPCPTRRDVDNNNLEDELQREGFSSRLPSRSHRTANSSSCYCPFPFLQASGWPFNMLEPKNSVSTQQSADLSYSWAHSRDMYYLNFQFKLCCLSLGLVFKLKF